MSQETLGDLIEARVKNGITHAAFGMLVMLVRPLATLTEVFFRRKMGVRYFTYWNIWIGVILIVVGACFYNGVSLEQTMNPDGMYAYGFSQRSVTKHNFNSFRITTIIGSVRQVAHIR